MYRVRHTIDERFAGFAIIGLLFLARCRFSQGQWRYKETRRAIASNFESNSLSYNANSLVFLLLIISRIFIYFFNLYRMMVYYQEKTFCHCTRLTWQLNIDEKIPVTVLETNVVQCL